MKYDYRVALVVSLTVTMVVYGVSFLPALTSGGNAVSGGVSQAQFDAAVSQELAYCRAQPGAINCACFAQKSGYIMTYAEPRVSSAFYADKQDLARGQAARGC